MEANPLDQVIWSALTTQHAALAEGDDLARRYPIDLGLFAATRDTSPEAWASLERLIPAGSGVGLFSAEPVAPTGPLQVGLHELIDQMMAPPLAGRVTLDTVELLGAADVAEMRELVELTKPGPFQIRTHELGRYLGIRVGGRLVAMAGERLHLDGYTEISAVCAHPDHRGQGLPAALLIAVAQLIEARGEQALLHVLSSNEAAIRLYRKLGFVTRRQLHLAVVERQA